jgi:hypothetical protein
MGLRQFKDKSMKSRITVIGKRVSTILGIALGALLPVVAQAQYANTNLTVLDINFDGDTLGSQPFVHYPNPNPYPIPATYPQAIGYFPPAAAAVFGTTNGISFTVADVAGMTKALVMSNSAPATATATHVSFVDHNFTVPKVARSIMEIDFSQIETPAGTNGGFRSDWLIVAFKQNINPTQVAWAIGTKHGYPGEIFLQQNFPNSLSIGTYTNGLPTHIELIAYYEGGGRFDVYLNGDLAAQNVPFNSPMANDNDQVKEFFIQQVAGENSLNVVAFDNFKYTITIPEPSTMILLGMGGLALCVRRARRR